MEASQKPQLPLADATVRLVADRLVVERLEIADERAARVVRERAGAGQRPADTVTKAAVGRALNASDARHHAEGEENRKVIAELRRELTELKEQREANRRVAEAEDVGTRKGFTFEERVHAAIERIARLRGDCAAHTGGEAAEGGGQRGDVVVELGAADGPALGRVLFEAKDKKLSQNDAWRELND